MSRVLITEIANPSRKQKLAPARWEPSNRAVVIPSGATPKCGERLNAESTECADTPVVLSD